MTNQHLSTEELLDVYSSVVADFDVRIGEYGKVHIVSLTGKRITAALKETIARHFEQFVTATRADEIAGEAIERARSFTLDVPAIELNVPTDGFMAMETAPLPATRTRRGRKAGA